MSVGLNCMQSCTSNVAGIISGWQLGVQADAHELLIGILNSGSVIAANVNNLIQFNMVTEGILHHSLIDVNFCILLMLNLHFYMVSNCFSYL